MLKEQLALASKSSSSLVSPLERRVARRVVPRIPGWLGTHHLTMLTLAWGALAVLFGHLAAGDLRWLWGTSAVILLQYLTDFFDGKVGKYRGTGLVKWGFYMDHLLDYVFLCSLLVGYSFILPPGSQWHLFLVLAVFGGFMVNSFLAFSATGSFRISHLKLGPTEFRIALCVLNALLVFDGPRRMAKALVRRGRRPRRPLRPRLPDAAPALAPRHGAEAARRRAGRPRTARAPQGGGVRKHASLPFDCRVITILRTKSITNSNQVGGSRNGRERERGGAGAAGRGGARGGARGDQLSRRREGRAGDGHLGDAGAQTSAHHRPALTAGTGNSAPLHHTRRRVRQK